MDVAARTAAAADLPELERLYRLLEAEMALLEPVWPLADGLPEPAAEALDAARTDPTATLVVGTIDGVAVGFLLGRSEPMTPQAAGARTGSVRLVFTEEPARRVGVGEAMLGAYLAAARAEGITLFDAHVTPGQRATKNFFESNGFSARSIVMHHGGGGR
ncbi:MAG: GNAT family N-acetyltransferase [Actinobacteria bacterium]|nr:GNAT family N-acetyltransferase [Actinomycetota bacterium]